MVSLLSIRLIQPKFDSIGIENLDPFNVTKLLKFNVKQTKC
jgi:hypothetical protein